MKKHVIILGIAAIFTASQPNVFGQTNLIVQTPKYPWQSSAAVGLTLTRGNSDTVMFTANAQAQKKTPENEFILGADGSYGENNSVKNSETLHGFDQYNRLFSDRVYGYARLEALHDAIADLQYRVTLSPGVGYYFLKETNTTLAGEVGPGAITERLGDEDNTYATFRVAERFEHKFGNHGARLWQNVEIIPEVDKPDNYLVNAELGIEASITKKLSLQTYVDDNFNNRPAAGRQKNDVKLVSAIAYKF